MRALIALAKEKFGKVDVLFANAGIMPAGMMSELKVNDWMGMVDINIKGVLNSMAAVLPEFIAQKKDISLSILLWQEQNQFQGMRFIQVRSIL